MSESFRRVTRAAAVVRLAATVLVAVLAVTCTRDQPTAPIGHLEPGQTATQSSIPSDSGLRALESPATATGHINVLANGNYELVPQIVGTYPTPTVVTAHVTGFAEGTPWKQPWYFTEKGYLGNCGGDIPLIAGWSECQATRTIRVSGAVQMAGNWLPTPANCGQWDTDPCPTFSGGYDGELDRLDATIETAPTDTSLHPGGTATIRWWPVPDSLGGFATPTTFERGYFDPDSSGGYPADTARACTIVGDSCKISPRGSGTLHLWVMVNGQLVHKTAHITMPTLVLAASPTSGHSGVRITFTPSWTDGTALTGSVDWQWTPDHSPGQTSACGFSGWNFVCTMQVYESGTMAVILHFSGSDYRASAHVVIYTNFALVADPSNVPIGDTTTFVPLYDGIPGRAARWRWLPADTATGDAQCADGVYPCRKQMIVSGRMWAFTSAGPAQGDSNYADVTVTLPLLAVTVDRSEVGEGDTAVFTATLSPSRQSYQVVGWTWAVDTSGTLASKSPVGPGRLQRRAPRDPVMRGLADSTTSSGDTTIDAVNDTAYMDVPPDTVQTQPCQLKTLTCAASIHRYGYMALTVNALGRHVVSSAAAGVRYYCPVEVPIEAVGIAGGEPIVMSRAHESYQGSGIPLGTHLVQLWSPFIRLEDGLVRPGTKGNYEMYNYHIGRGVDDHGWPVIVTPWLGIPEGSWVQLECKAWMLKDGTLYGNVWPTGRLKAVVNPNATPP